MPGPANIAIGSVANSFVVAVAVPAGAALATGPSTQERTYAVPGLIVGDVVTVQKPTFQNTIGIVGARVSAADTLAINFLATAGTPSLTAETYLVQVDRHSFQSLAQIPTGIA